MEQGYEALTEREKQTLRLLLVGHDAKSLARHFGLSIHTINERLRDARRKLSVSSSKEAARLLHQVEAADPEIVGNTPLRAADAPPARQSVPQPDPTPHPPRRAAWAIGGLTMISLLTAAVLALSSPLQAPAPGASPVPDSAVSGAARAWLAMVDGARWQESWADTGRSFRSLNTAQAWRSVSERVRAPLGPVLSRTLLSEQDTPAPPNGYKTVRFRTDFANRSGATEIVSLDQEDGGWKVVGIYIE